MNLSDTGVHREDLLVHDAHAANPSLAFVLSRMTPPVFPTPIGIFRQVDVPTFDAGMNRQLANVKASKGEGTLESLIHAGDTWTVA